MPLLNSKKLYQSVYRLPNLLQAWDSVKQNGSQSRSETTRLQIRDFENGARQKIDKIQKQLKSNTFKFSMVRGVPIYRPGKDDRPLVVSPIENRIVQRAILNILQKDKGIRKLVNHRTSFGGVEDKSVSDALNLIANQTKNGAKFFARSDIKSFFTKIPKEIVLQKIKESLVARDELFEAILEQAITIELENLEALGEKASLFPLDETGVAQGSCLSPLLGNIFLREFDEISNSPDVSCVRFVDDYVILGPDEKAVKAKFIAGKTWLKKKGLDVYDPFESGDKGESGAIHLGFEFLGCDIYPGRISPSSKSVEKFKEKITLKLRECLNPAKGLSLAEALTSIKNTTLGWGNSYQFCNDRNLILTMDSWLNEEVAKFYQTYIESISEITLQSEIVMRLGIKPLVTCKSNPIYSKKIKKSRSELNRAAKESLKKCCLKGNLSESPVAPLI
jgi:RNA-directed DNA polymerase